MDAAGIDEGRKQLLQQESASASDDSTGPLATKKQWSDNETFVCMHELTAKLTSGLSELSSEAAKEIPATSTKTPAQQNEQFKARIATLNILNHVALEILQMT
jgi:hypothetical protein